MERIIIYQVLVRLAGNTQTSIKPWGSIEENGCGKFDDLNSRFLSEINKLGATHIWLTGILEHASCTAYPEHGIGGDSPLVVKGKAGSPYAIKDYFDVCPDLAKEPANRMAEFENLIKRCHEADLKAIIDFVPNHVARKYSCDQEAGKDHEFGANDKKDTPFDKDNNFYYLPGEQLKLPDEVYALPTSREYGNQRYQEEPAKATGNDCFSANPSFDDWYETVKLNYGVNIPGGGTIHFEPVPDTWKKMLAVIRFWASKGVSGFRCDMAEMVPVEFWTWLISEIKKEYPDLLFIAESYNPRAYGTYHQAGFDYLYDKDGFYDTLKSVMLGAPANRITGVWQALDGLDDIMLRFLENHDEERIASHHFAGKAEPGIPAMAVAAAMNKGPVMIYFGQETGEKAEGSSGFSGDDGKTSIFDYDRVPSFQKWFNQGDCNQDNLSERERFIRNTYKLILNTCRENVFANGHFYDLMYNNTDMNHSVYAFLRWTKNQIMLVASNFSEKNAVEANIRIPPHFWSLFDAGGNNAFTVKSRIYSTSHEMQTPESSADIGINIVLNPMSFDYLEITPER